MHARSAQRDWQAAALDIPGNAASGADCPQQIQRVRRFEELKTLLSNPPPPLLNILLSLILFVIGRWRR